MKTGLTACVLILLQSMSFAQPAPGGFGGGFGGDMAGFPNQPTEPPPKIEQQLMPGEQFDNIPLDEALKFINEKLPEFNSVVVRSPGTEPDYPTLPPMSVKNVTIGQFLEFLKVSFPGVSIQRINGPAGPLYVVKVAGGPMDRPRFQDGGFGGGFMPGMPGGGMPALGGQPGQPHDVVQVYRLTDIIASLLSARPDDQRDPRAALADILSLVQSALDESGEKEKVVLKVHEQTQTLLFRGSSDKQSVLEQVLNTLRPSQDPAQIRELTELREKLRVLEAQRELDLARRDEASRMHEKEMDNLRMRLRDTEQRLGETQTQNAVLRGQLDQAQKPAR